MTTTAIRTPKEIWEIALSELQTQVSRSNYRTWFERTVGLRYEGNQFVVGVPNAFVAEYLEKNQRSLIEKALIPLTPPGVEIMLQVNGRLHGDNHERPSVPKPIQSGLKLNYVFDTFVKGKSNEEALVASLAIAENPGKTYNPLYIHGPSGLGKTHLLQAIAQKAMSRSVRAICVTAEQFTNEFISALKTRNTDEFRNKYCCVDILCMDDIYFIGGKKQTEESFFHVFNGLHDTNRQIVVTSDRPPGLMPSFEERMRTRLLWGLVVEIHPPDRETCVSILRSKFRHKGVNVSEEIIEFIGQGTYTNIRSLENSVNQVLARTSFLKAPAPTLDIAKEALKNMANEEAVGIPPMLFVETVALYFKVSMEEMIGRQRGKKFNLARRVAMFLLKEHTNLSCVEIGGLLGNRDAASVSNAHKRIAEDMSVSPSLNQQIGKVLKQLKL